MTQTYLSKLPASPNGVGAILSHIMENNDEKVIAYASRTLMKSERNYSQLEKEALALVFGVKIFHQYIYGRKFILETDHKPLTYIFGEKKACHKWPRVEYKDGEYFYLLTTMTLGTLRVGITILLMGYLD